MKKRRSFSLNVVDTKSFLEMPCSAQALYFHLGIRADDDGTVPNAYDIAQRVGARIADIDILTAKGYILAEDVSNTVKGKRGAAKDGPAENVL